MSTKELPARTKKTPVKTTDISTNFRRMVPHGKVEVDGIHQALKLTGKGTVTLKPDNGVEKSDAFTVEAVITPSRLKKNQYVLESQNPPVRIELKPDGTVVGSIHTAKGWESIDSGERKVAAKETASVRFIRKEAGEIALEINDRHANSGAASEDMVALGNNGITIGGDSSGKTNLYHGTVGGIRMRKGVLDGITLDNYRATEKKLADDLKSHLGFAGRLEVLVEPDMVDERFNSIKAILSAAGVEDISGLSTLTIDEPTTIAANQVMVAPPKTTGSTVNWTEVAGAIITAGVSEAVGMTARLMPNRNSVKALKYLSGATNGSEGKESDGKPKKYTSMEKDHDRALRNIMYDVTKGEGSTKIGSFTAKRNSKLALRIKKPLLSELVRPTQKIEITDKNFFDDMEENAPDNWAAFSAPQYYLTSITTIPVNTSVIIAGRLDLTNQTLRIEPDVKTLYIIAEEVVGDVNASITWRRPGGYTPAREDDPNKNGRSYTGVHTSSGSRNGLAGGDGLNGDPGFIGANGIDAPNLEVWVKNLTAMPDIDLNGEDGIKGGRGQRGGRGGNGAKGQTGKWWWFFGAQCWENPGHGGDGGDGGDGGRGGRGGTGGHGGEVAIGVLQGTLASTVQARAFKIQNQRGQEGRGGDGGSGGYGGTGGLHGNDYVDGGEVCGTGVNGDTGDRGQPGATGHDGHEGGDGSLRFFEFTEENWIAQLTRPWLYELTPSLAFPGDEVIITGTRFADNDRVIVDGQSHAITINADESASFVLRTNMTGGEKDLYVRRHDGDESNHMRLWIKPRLHSLPDGIARDSEVTLTGLAFVTGAKVLYDGLLVDATVDTRTSLRFTVPGTGGVPAPENDVSLAVRNPDGLESNERIATLPRTLDSGFRIGVHDFSFANFASGNPSWGTFEGTFGALEVWHELLDPIFGHPILTVAFYIFYQHFLKGVDNGGLATGFCTSLSTIVLDEFHTGSTDTYSRYTLDDATRERFTAIHGRLLSRESLIDFHDQGRRGTANVATVFRRIEASLRDGADRHSAQMLFFVPSGAAWDEGYFDMLGDSHCIVPIRMVYPVGHDGISMDGVKLFCWDCNHPGIPGDTAAHNCRVEFRGVGGEIRFSYFDGGSTEQFTSEDGITLATMTNGKYLLSDHDMPFSGPFGLTTFVLDFLLSPADLLVEDSEGRRTGLDGGSIVAEIDNSHPAYLAKNLYMLPSDEALTRHITGNGNGTYDYHSIASNGTSISLENVATITGEEDVLAVNADASQVRFTPGSSKAFRLNLAKEIGGQVRAVSVDGIPAGPMTSMDLTVSPDLSVIRVGNQEAAANVNVRVSVYEKVSGTNATLDRNSVNLPTDNDLMVAVSDWEDLTVEVRNLPFEM